MEPMKVQQEFWMDKAKKYAESNGKGKEQWTVDALYCAYLRGVQEALGIRIID